MNDLYSYFPCHTADTHTQCSTRCPPFSPLRWIHNLIRIFFLSFIFYYKFHLNLFSFFLLYYITNFSAGDVWFAFFFVVLFICFFFLSLCVLSLIWCVSVWECFFFTLTIISLHHNYCSSVVFALWSHQRFQIQKALQQICIHFHYWH